MNRKQYEDKRNRLLAEAQQLIEAGKIDEANAKMAEINKLDEAFQAAATAQANLQAMQQTPAALENFGNGDTFGAADTQAEPESIYDSIEYRTAFMNFVLRGTPIPAKFAAAAGPTKTTDVGSVISPVVVQRIVEKMEFLGMILPRVTKTSYAPGATIPTSSVKPEATWVAEGGTSQKQKKTTGYIDIKGYKLRCAVSMTLEASVMSLAIFETVFVNNVSQAMVKTKEISFIYGTGSGQPEGVLVRQTGKPADQTITLAAAAPTYEELCDAEGALPAAYENGAVWNMTKKTFMKFVGMTDEQGQPIARINYGLSGQPQRYLLGREVLINDYMPTLGTEAARGKTVAFLYNWADYMHNTNYAMTVKTYEDNDTEDQVTKAVEICDGKPIDMNSLVEVIAPSA